MAKRGKLELTWVGKYEEEKLEPRILVEDEAKSYGEPTDGNLLIHGDNLLALKALESEFTGKIKCIYIDPPYNTGSRDFVYDDAYIDKNDLFSHSKWLSFIKCRLEIAHKLLRENGSIFISIDDNEQAPLKMLCDEIFGEEHFVADISWQRAYSPRNDSRCNIDAELRQ